MQAFEHCVVKTWNLSYDCLTGVAVCAKLRELRETEPEFWMELTTKQSQDCIPAENTLQPEDLLIDDAGLDDSDIPIGIIVDESIARGGHDRDGYKVVDGGAFIADTLAEEFDNVEASKPSVVDDGDKELGRGPGKRIKQRNWRYDSKSFWMHGNDSDSLE